MKFIDQVRVQILAGKGGDGFVGWRREKFVPRGGPDGGNGGDGGAVAFRASKNLNTLLEFSYNPLIRAQNGSPGGPNLIEGKRGKELIKDVPVGTEVYFEDSLIADLSEEGALWIAARGGRGGKGNAHFKSATNQAPDYAQKGQAGEEREYKLVLKSVADVGLVGFPSAGKSTLISKVSAASPKVAEYPFTTLTPQLGVVDLASDKRFVIADIPGLIPGAHAGKGLGDQFLRHIERTKLLVQFIDVGCSLLGKGLDPGDPSIPEDSLKEAVWEQFEGIDQELRLFSEQLAEYPRVVAFSKSDLPSSEQAFQLTKSEFERRGLPVFLVSSVTGYGLNQLLKGVWQRMQPPF